MVLSQNRCDALLLVLGKTFLVLWALVFVAIGVGGLYRGIEMIATGGFWILYGIMALILGISALLAVHGEFCIHRLRIDRYFTAEDDQEEKNVKCMKVDSDNILTVKIYQTTEGWGYQELDDQDDFVAVNIGTSVITGTKSEIENHIAVLNSLGEPIP